MKFPFCGFSEEEFHRHGAKAAAFMQILRQSSKDCRVYMDAKGNIVEGVEQSVILWTPMPGGEPSGTIYALNTEMMKPSYHLKIITCCDSYSPHLPIIPAD